jgi:hypothetical protein
MYRSVWLWIDSDTPAQKDEVVALDAAFVEYIKTKNTPDLPPGIAVLFAMIAYSVPRMTKPKTKSKMKKFTNWCKKRYIMHKFKLSSKDAEEIISKEEA